MLALYDAAAVHLGIDKTRSVHGGFGPNQPKPIKEDRREWLASQVHSQYERSAAGDWATLTMFGQYKQEPIWYFEYLTRSTSWIRCDLQDIPPLPMLSFGFSLDCLLTQQSLMAFCRAVVQIFLVNDRTAYGLIDLVSTWDISLVPSYNGSPGWGTWERLLDAHFWREFCMYGRQHARGVFWGNIFGREMADRLRAAGLHEMLAFNRDFHPQWDAIVIDGEHGGQAILLDDDPVLFAQKRGGRLICHAGVVQNGIVLRAAMMKAGLM